MDPDVAVNATEASLGGGRLKEKSVIDGEVTEYNVPLVPWRLYVVARFEIPACLCEVSRLFISVSCQATRSKREDALV